MRLPTGLYRVFSWLKHQITARNTGGHGVHSPYLFEWVRMVMGDKHRYYTWDKIEQCREKMLRDNRVLRFVDYGSGAKTKGVLSERRVSDVAKSSLTHKRYAQMLARLVNWLGHQLTSDASCALTIVELGTSLGITTAYLAAMNERNKVMTYEGCEDVAEVAKENWKSLGMTNIECYVGAIDVAMLDREIDRVDVAFLDANHTYLHTYEYFTALAKKIHAKSVIVVDDIHHSEEMEKAWKKICADERVTSTMDLYQMGLVFFDQHYWKRNYTMRL